jgi:uncharacterized protein YkwD
MKASLFLAASGAVMAMAGPINKRVMETEWVMEVVTVTVTSGAQATAKANSDAVFIDPPAPTTKLPDVPVEQAPVVENPVVEAPRRPTTTVRGPPPRPTTKAPEPAPQPTKAPEPAPKPTTQQPSQPAPSAPSAPSGSDYKSTVLYQHNIHRANHSAPDLTWDDTLAGYAENTARGCVFQHDMDQGSGGYGQNLAYWGASGDIGSKQIQSAAGAITNQWYNDEAMAWTFYGAANPPASSDLHAWGHFTQVVWKSSTKLGCATVQCAAGTLSKLASWYTVCNYNPPGNFGGQYGTNVLEPLGNARVTA